MQSLAGHIAAGTATNSSRTLSFSKCHGRSNCSRGVPSTACVMHRSRDPPDDQLWPVVRDWQVNHHCITPHLFGSRIRVWPCRYPTPGPKLFGLILCVCRPVQADTSVGFVIVIQRTMTGGSRGGVTASSSSRKLQAACSLSWCKAN